MSRLYARKVLPLWLLLGAFAFFQTPQGDPPHLIYERLAIYVAGVSFMMSIFSYLDAGREK